MPLQNPRPRKYASAAERQKAYRNRYAAVETRVLPEVAATLDDIAATIDIPRAELVAQMINFALLNRNWKQLGAFGRSITEATERARKPDAFGYWIDSTFDHDTRLYTVVVRDSQSNIVSAPRVFDKKSDFAKLRPIDFDPIDKG